MVVVAIVASLAALTFVQIVRARVTTHERLAIKSLRLLATSCHFFFVIHQGFPADLAELGPPTSDPPYLDDTDLLAGSKQGYLYIYTPGPGPSPATFALLANPQSQGITGERHFFVDESLNIHATSEVRDATVADPIVQ